MWLPAGHNPARPRFRLRQWPAVVNDPVAQTPQATMVAADLAPSMTATLWTVARPSTPFAR
eukprot:9789913-Lingulodinium_polyedra.AAC.1